MSHTKEPWFQNHDDILMGDEHGDLIACCEWDFGFDGGANARRIVACVNACAGVADETLSGGWTAKGISDYAKSLEAQRDKLLAVLTELQECSAYWSEYDVPLGIVGRIDAAIAAAKGGAA